MRVVKDAEERRNEILDVAEVLFGTKGFEQTSTNDILEKVGIARGTLYYHFKSKEDILDAMIERMNNQLLAMAAQIAGQQTIPVLERLTRTIMALNVDTSLGSEVMEQVHKPQNALMHQKMQEKLLSGINPIVTKLVEEGIRQGIFYTDFPAEAVEMCMIYSNIAFDDLQEQSEEQRKQRIEGFIYNVERLFGTEPGALESTLLKIFQKESE